MKPAWKINLETVGVIAEKEMLDAVRNRWFHVFVVFFSYCPLPLSILDWREAEGSA